MPQTPLPFVTYSDGPRLPSGLARICRDLTSRLFAEQDALGIQVLQVGYDPLPGPAVAWPLWSAATLDTEGDWGCDLINRAWLHQFGDQPGILFTIWDASRAFPLLDARWAEEHWGYFPVDAHNVNGTLGGPPAEAIRRYSRVLAYGRWGSEVLATLRPHVPYLPHGLDLGVWDFHQTPEMLGQAERILQLREGEIVLGCVATNQRRKDLAVFFAAVAELRRRGHNIRGWLHTDRMIREWAVPQLVEDFGLKKKVTVTLSLTDQELAACYSVCGATLHPGLGEGFGYPIVESLACGTPSVHGRYAGGVELVPLNAWQVPPETFRIEGLYGLQRPVFSPVDFANAVERALDWKRHDERVCQEFCRGAVAHLNWTELWPRWRSWFRKGLEEIRG